MSVEGMLGTGEKLALLSASGPASAVTVTAGDHANVDLTVSVGVISRVLKALGVKSISGLPTGAVIEGYSFTNETTLRIVVFNPTGSDITVTADSVSATVLVKGL